MKMTKDELVALEIEKRSLMETVKQLTNFPDARMSIQLDEFCKGLEEKIRQIQKTIDENLSE